jgi:hypothetical protein
MPKSSPPACVCFYPSPTASAARSSSSRLPTACMCTPCTASSPLTRARARRIRVSARLRAKGHEYRTRGACACGYPARAGHEHAGGSRATHELSACPATRTRDTAACTRTREYARAHTPRRRRPTPSPLCAVTGAAHGGYSASLCLCAISFGRHKASLTLARRSLHRRRGIVAGGAAVAAEDERRVPAPRPPRLVSTPLPRPSRRAARIPCTRRQKGPDPLRARIPYGPGSLRARIPRWARNPLPGGRAPPCPGYGPDSPARGPRRHAPVVREHTTDAHTRTHTHTVVRERP